MGPKGAIISIFSWCHHDVHKIKLFCGKYHYNISIIVKIAKENPGLAWCKTTCNWTKLVAYDLGSFFED